MFEKSNELQQQQQQKVLRSLKPHATDKLNAVVCKAHSLSHALTSAWKLLGRQPHARHQRGQTLHSILANRLYGLQQTETVVLLETLSIKVNFPAAEAITALKRQNMALYMYKNQKIRPLKGARVYFLHHAQPLSVCNASCKLTLNGGVLAEIQL